MVMMMRRRRFLPLAFGFVTSSVACNAIFGLEDWTLRESDAGQPTTDASGDQDRDASAEAAADAPADVVDASVTCNPATPWGKPKLQAGVNDPSSQNGGSSLTAEELVIFFTSTRSGSDAGPGLGKSDIFFATRASRLGVFGAPSAVQDVNSTSDEYGVSIDPTGTKLFFHSDRAAGNKVYVATRTGASFGAPVVVANIPAGAVSPFVRADGKELLYSFGGKLWAAPSNGSGFAAGVQISELNAVGASEDYSPVLSADGRTIFFASTRAEGDAAGGIDIWTATRATLTDRFAGLRNVAELNSPVSDYPSWLSPDGCRLYMSSNTAGGLDQIYLAERAP